MLIVDCYNCGKKINIPPSRFEMRDKFYCSKKCEGIDRVAKPNAVCPVCGVDFHIKLSRLKRTKNKICCSKKCGSIYRSTWFSGNGNHQTGMKGELNYSYKSDIRLSSYGYILVRALLHPFRNVDNFVFLHRFVMEKYLRACEPDSEYLISVPDKNILYLDPEIEVHHIDNNKLNNAVSNLECIDKGSHVSLHNGDNVILRGADGNFTKVIGKKKKSVNKNLIKNNLQDAGLDILSNEDVVVPARNSKLISTDLYIAIPENHVGLIWSRSGLSVKHNIEVGAGCIDNTYRGEVKVHLYNHGDNDYVVSSGDKIAQLLTIPIHIYHYEQVDKLTSTERGAGGFGSTGK
jgi:dUTP pyrophosphatase